MFIRIRDMYGDKKLVNTDKIVNIFAGMDGNSYINMDDERDDFNSIDSITEIEQKLYNAGLINN